MFWNPYEEADPAGGCWKQRWRMSISLFRSWHLLLRILKVYRTSNPSGYIQYTSRKCQIDYCLQLTFSMIQEVQRSKQVLKMFISTNAGGIDRHYICYEYYFTSSYDLLEGKVYEIYTITHYYWTYYSIHIIHVEYPSCYLYLYEHNFIHENAIFCMLKETSFIWSLFYSIWLQKNIDAKVLIKIAFDNMLFSFKQKYSWTFVIV